LMACTNVSLIGSISEIHSYSIGWDLCTDLLHIGTSPRSPRSQVDLSHILQFRFISLGRGAETSLYIARYEESCFPVQTIYCATGALPYQWCPSLYF
jgi:hypothetical protein